MGEPEQEILIQPGRLRGEPLLPPGGLFVVTPGGIRIAAEAVRRQGARRHFFFNAQLYVVPPSSRSASFFLAGPAVGAPMAVMALEKLIALGAKRCLVFGWCGSLTEGLQAGTVLLPTWAVSEEGTSRHYPAAGPPSSSHRLREAVAATLRDRGVMVREGPIWTTDAPYRETGSRVATLGRQGIEAVDMEFSALCVVAAHRRVELAAALLVSDALWGGGWRPVFGKPFFKSANHEIICHLLDFCRGGGSGERSLCPAQQ